MKKHHWLMGVALVVAAWLALFGDKSPATGIVEPTPRAPVSLAYDTTDVATPQNISRATPVPQATTHVLALVSRDTLIGGAHADIAEGPGLFASHSWTPSPPPPQPLPPPPPTAPPLPFTYIGKMIRDNIWEVYLVRGDQTYIVRDQTEIDGTYHVDMIKPPTLSLTYLPLKQAQTLTIGGSD